MVNIIFCISGLISAIVNLKVYRFMKQLDSFSSDIYDGFDDAMFTDDSLNDSVNDAMQGGMDLLLGGTKQTEELLLATAVLAVASVIVCGIGVYGAIKYNLNIVLCTCIWYGVLSVFYAISLNFIGLLLAALFAYPNIMLYLEMKKGVITPGNYINERHSCCCLPSV